MATVSEVMVAQPGSSEVPTLVGREREWHTLTVRCEQVRQRKGGLLFLEGEAGIGKTVLMQRLRTWAEANGFCALWGNHIGHHQAPPLYGLRQAIAPLFGVEVTDGPETVEQKVRSALAGRWSNLSFHQRSLAHLLAPLEVEDVFAGTQEERLQALYHLFFRLLACIAQEQPLLVFLDDLHWADSLTLDCLAYLQATAIGQPFLLVGAFRPEETAPQMKQLFQEKQAKVCRLSRLDMEAVTQMAVQAELDGDPGFCQRLHQFTAGVPLFVEQYLQMCRENPAARSLSRRPESITRTIARRLGGLCPEEHHLLQAAAVLGDAFEVDILSQVHGQPLPLVLESLGVLEGERELIRGTAEGFEFCHTLVRQVVHEEMPAAQRQGLHLRAGEVLEGLLTSRPEKVFAAAHHYQEARQQTRAAQVLFRAGQQAQALEAHREAREYYQQALAAMPPTAALRAEIEEALGDVNYALHEQPEVAHAFYESALCRHDTPQRRTRLYRKLSRCWHSDRFRQWHYLQLALKESSPYPDSVEHIEVLALLIIVHNPHAATRQECLAYVVSCAARALRLLRRQPPNRVLLALLATSLHSLRDKRNVNLARKRRLFRRALRLAEQMGEWSWAISIRYFLADTWRGADLERAIAEAEKTLRLAEQFFPVEHETFYGLLELLLQYSLAQGHTERISRYAKLLQELDPALFVAHGLCYLTRRALQKETWSVFGLQLRELCAELNPRMDTFSTISLARVSHCQRLACENNKAEEWRAALKKLYVDYPNFHANLQQWELQVARNTPRPSVPHHQDLSHLYWQDEAGTSRHTLFSNEEVEIIPGPEVGLGWLNCAPCLLGRVSGDFVLEARISNASHLQRAGGFAVFQGKQLIRFASGVDHIGQVSLGWHNGTAFHYAGVGYLNAHELRLRLVRRGRSYEGLVSPDGEQWYTCGALEFGAEEPVEAGLFAECNYEYWFPQPFPIRFADFSLWSEDKAVPHPALLTKAKTNLFLLPNPGETFYGMVGQSRVFRAFCEQLQEVARSVRPLLICGESGTGKELAAEAVHQLSGFQAGPLVPVNVATLGGELIESELFGYKQGAFTGALKDKAGLFEAAAGGSIFLDEIAELPLHFQAKLLRVLEKGEVRALGDTAVKTIVVRCLAATNRDLFRMVAGGQFREDLFFRFGQPLEVPPLRLRRDDIPHLAAYFLTAYAGDAQYGITQEAMERLLAHDWPDNIRGLEKVIERAIGRASKGVIAAGNLVLRPPVSKSKLSRPGAKRPTSADELRHLLQECNHEISALSRRCGVNRKTVYRWFDKFGLAIADLRTSTGD